MTDKLHGTGLVNGPIKHAGGDPPSSFMQWFMNLSEQEKAAYVLGKEHGYSDSLIRGSKAQAIMAKRVVAYQNTVVTLGVIIIIESILLFWLMM